MANTQSVFFSFFPAFFYKAANTLYLGQTYGKLPNKSRVNADMVLDGIRNVFCLIVRRMRRFLHVLTFARLATGAPP